jgi:hypothetical protein
MPASEIADCRADMAAVTVAVNEILGALGAVPPLFGNQTWQGLSADQWAALWNARRHQLTALLDAVAAEQPQIIARLEKAQAAHGT